MSLKSMVAGGLTPFLIAAVAAGCSSTPAKSGGSGGSGSGSGGSGLPTTAVTKPDDGPISAESYIDETAQAGDFALFAAGSAAPLVVSSGDFAGVLRAADDLAADILSVSELAPAVAKDAPPKDAHEIILAGTLGKSPLIDALVASKKLKVDEIAGKWETFLIQVVEKPMDGVDHALVITGSDQRGTIFGLYDVSGRIGVSPWYYWDDVPARHASALYVRQGRFGQGEPAVKYRGFFINDENPATGTWAPKTFGNGLARITRAGTGQVTEYTSGLNHRYWEKVFELALRLKANYIWPAVWGRAFADDDPENHATATRYGVVMGSSHEAPMMRGIEEWNRRVDPTTRTNAGVDETVTHMGKDDFSSNGNGEWRYSTNADSLKAYWKQGIQRMVDQKFEGIVTLGMRGPGDIKLPADTGIPLIEQLIKDQRDIISQVTGGSADKVPQVWTLYKEVKNWWDGGLRVPDDVTVVFCDDNWGNMRNLPKLSEQSRSGGYGIYYHFDYVGGGRSYKWVDSNLLPNLWEQLNLSYAYGAKRIWMFNVGDMKNNEVPLQFAMDYAWNPSRIPSESLSTWLRNWAAQQFGTDQADNIAAVLSDYSKLQSDRKPELLNRKITLDPTKDPAKDASAILYSDQTYFTKDASGMVPPPAQRAYTDANPFSLTNYAEMERAVEGWQKLAAKADSVRKLLPSDAQDAFHELVNYEVQAGANLYALRLAQFQNALYSQQGRASANDFGMIAQQRLADDQTMADTYNTQIAGGKWSGWQTQPHIGYGDQDRYGGNATWQQPQLNEQAIPDLMFPPLTAYAPVKGPSMGVAIDGATGVWTATTDAATTPAVLPNFSPYQTQRGQYIEVFNRGDQAFLYEIKVNAPPGVSNGSPYSAPWIIVTPSSGRIDANTKQIRATISVDWPHAPTGAASVPISFTVSATDNDNTTVTVNATADTAALPDWMANRFVEANRVVSIEAEHFNRAIETSDIKWKHIDDLGRTGGGLTPWPPTASSQTPGGASPRLEYDMYLFNSGDVTVRAYLSPRNSVIGNSGLQYGVSIDGGAIQTVNINDGDDLTGGGNRQWERHTSDNVNLTTTVHNVKAPGTHTLKVWMVDPTVVIQKLVVDLGGAKDSYLGPPESYRTVN